MAWAHAKREGLLPDDDPIPHRALQYLAIEQGLCDRNDLDDGWRLPIDAYNGALDAIRDDGLDPGRESIDLDPPGVNGSDSGRALCADQWVETCAAPPEADAEPLDVDARREAMQGELYDRFIDREGSISVWAHNPGEGKTTTAAIAAADRDRPFVILLPTHRNCREFQLDETKPDAFHLKGASKPRDPECMDAKISGEGCPEHGDPDACPSMCPILDLDSNEPVRQQYTAIAEAWGVRAAHTILGLSDREDHDGGCAWQRQWSRTKSADAIVTVADYLTLSTVREHGDIILDDAGGLIDEAEIEPGAFREIAGACRDCAGLAGTDGDAFEAIAAFAKAIGDALAENKILDLGSRDATLPETPNLPPVRRTYDSRDEIPDDVCAGDIEETRRKQFVGEGGQYVYETAYTVETADLAERLAQAKQTYEETMVERARRHALGSTPISLDPVLAAWAAVADAAGDPDESRAARLAAGIDASLETCPRCSRELVERGGTRMCDKCLWHEDHSRLVTAQATPARVNADVNTKGADGGSTIASGVTIRRLPDLDALPDPSDVLVLDATARRRIYAGVWGLDPHHVEIEGDTPYHLPGAQITQIADGAYHRSTIEDSQHARRRLQAAIERVDQLHESVVYVTVQKAIPLLDWPDGAPVEYYYALRGIDDLADANAIVLVGAPHPDADALRSEAALLAADNPHIRAGGRELSTRTPADDETEPVDPPVYRKLVYADDDGDGRAIAAKTYTGVAGDLFDSRHADEIEQAAHRLRPILADGEADKKHVYLLTNVPTRLPVDRFTTLNRWLDPLDGLDVRNSALDLLDAMVDAALSDSDAPYAIGTDGTLDNVAGTASEWLDAAERAGLGISQPTVSRALRDLRDAGIVEEGAYTQRRGRLQTLTAFGAAVAATTRV